ncbi:hypothetical protein Tco_0910953 [Tanacetum coccineum]|uniref:Uncharacterized protein n=1 Tax=Tanacetum coccineum TaxID=301880 RepID=A0ABQ5CWJ3_9ASTR
MIQPEPEDLPKDNLKLEIAVLRKGYRIYNKRTRRLMKTIHVTFDEMRQTMAPVRISSGPEPIMIALGQLNSGLAPSPVPTTTYIPPTETYKGLNNLSLNDIRSLWIPQWARVLVTDMDPDELQSDLPALRRSYCLLMNDEGVLSMTSLEVNLASIETGTTVTVKWRRN